MTANPTTKSSIDPLAPEQYGLCEWGEESCLSDPFSPAAEKFYSRSCLGFVLSGWFDYRDRNGAATAVPGALLFGNEGEYFSCRHKDTLGNRRLVVRFAPHFLEAVGCELGLDRARFSCTMLAPGESATMLFGWMRRLNRPAQREDAAYALAAAALRATKAPVTPPPVSPRSRERIFCAIRHIEEFYAQPCTLTSLARQAGFSRYHFLRVFKAVTGRSVSRYVLDMRLRAAADRLLASKAPVGRIALESGFNDLSHFNACFRAMFGCPPRRWRKAA
jgi:AraC-like DNA-binding protein